MDRSLRVILAAVLLLCVVGRGAYLLYLVHADAIVTTTGDAPSYLGPARELVEHRRFTTPTLRMWSAPIGLLAALLSAVEPLQNATTATLLTKCNSALLLMMLATVGFAVFTDVKPRLRVLGLFGVIMAITTLVRPAMYYLPAFVLLLLLVRYVRRRAHWADLAKMTAAFSRR